MKHDVAELERTAKTFRADMWQTVCEDAVLECGIEQATFGPVQVTVFQALGHDPMLNTVLGAAEAGAVRDGHLERAIEWADSFDVDYRVPISRDLPEMSLAESWLNWNGFEQGSGLVRYVRDAAMPQLPGVPGVKVWEIADEDEGLAAETMVFSAGPVVGLPSIASILLFALPAQRHWRTYTAEVDGRIAGFGSMLIRGHIAVIGLDGTEEGYRCRGCNQALLRQRLVDAVEAGCDTVFAEVGECVENDHGPIIRNLVQAGFVPAYQSINWQRPRHWTAAIRSGVG